VNYSVTVNAPGAGTPTGNVIVSDGVDSCTGTVAGGSCAITITTQGNRTLTAVYAGDANFNGSTSAGQSHTVNAAPTATPTDTATPTNSPTPSSTPTDTATPTNSPTPSSTPTNTPTPTVVATFPATNILDTFDRANGGVGNNWEGLAGTSFYKIVSNRLDVQAGGPLVWKPSSFGTSQEAFVTLTTIDTRSPSQGVLLKVQAGSLPNAGAIVVVYDAIAKAVRVSTLRLNDKTWKLYASQAVSFGNGDQLGARALTNGDVRIYKNGTLVATVRLNAADQAFFNAKGGKIGIWAAAASGAVMDDFGGGAVAAQ
jgi:hypothetical protein